MRSVLIQYDEISKNCFVHPILFTIFYSNRTHNLFTMKHLMFILLVACMISCTKENHAYKISYNVSSTHYITGTKVLVVATHFNVFCSQLTKDEESCLLKQDSQTVMVNNPKAFNFKVEYVGTNTDFSNPENFHCQ